MTDVASLGDGSYTAVVDAIEDGLATVFFEQDGEEVGNAVLEATLLPTEAQHADTILEVTIEDGNIVDTAYDPEASKSRKESAQSRFDRLSERPSSEDET